MLLNICFPKKYWNNRVTIVIENNEVELYENKSTKKNPIIHAKKDHI
jgi:hypothetical protein